MRKISHYLLTAVGIVAVGAVLIWPRALTSQAQSGGRGAIQTPTGGPGPGAAPGATDPANATADLSPKPPVLPLPATEQAKRFWLPAGYRLEPVLSDPIIEDPAQVTFDGNGRMFVVELRGYFSDSRRDRCHSARSAGFPGTRIGTTTVCTSTTPSSSTSWCFRGS